MVFQGAVAEEGVVKGGGKTYHWAVDVQGKSPPKRSAKMSPVYSGIVSDVDAGRVASDRDDSEMRRFYDRLRQRGNPSNVSVVAVMRKILLQLNTVARRGAP